ncbi:hypothetical protein BH09DEP1_BH09DEP1_0540 [soil metagenome]
MLNFLFCLITVIFSASLLGMEEPKDPNVRRDTCIIEAFLGPKFDLSEVKDEVLFSCDDYRNKKKYTVPLKTAAIVVYQMRRDRCDISKFRGLLLNLTTKLTEDMGAELEDEEVKFFQSYRLHMFDSNNELAVHRGDLLATERKALEKESANKSAFFSITARDVGEKEKQIYAKCDEVRVNREAYKTAFSLADEQLVKETMEMCLRLKPLVSLADALKGLRIQCGQGKQPLKLTEL